MTWLSRSYHPDALFLTDGHLTVYYRDLAAICNHVRDLFKSRSSETPVVGIDTSDRFQASLWMAACWMAQIPFVPYRDDDHKPLSLFRPDITVSHSSNIPYQLFPGDFSLPVTPLDALFANSDTSSDTFFCGLLTSGSSGTPKKVPLLRRQMITAASHAFPEPIRARGQLWGNTLPLQHAGGLTIILRALLSGSGVFLWHRFDAKDIFEDLAANPMIKRISLVPTMLKRLLDANGSRSLPNEFEEILIGGGPAPPKLIQRARDLGWPVVFSYGMTETCGQVAAQNRDGLSPAESVGTLFPGHDVIILDDERRIVGFHDSKPHDFRAHDTGFDDSGSVWIRGPQVFAGYMAAHATLRDMPPRLDTSHLHDHDDVMNEVLKQNVKPVQMASASKPGIPEPGRYPWFDTGDYGRIDEDGNLYIEARRTDIIITGGQNVSASDVEAALLKISGIVDVGVTGVPDAEWGQKLVALVVTAHQEPRMGSKSLREFLSTRLPGYQIPKEIIAVNEIPRTELGKIRRKELLEMATNLLS